jgi:hypothetical protein
VSVIHDGKRSPLSLVTERCADLKSHFLPVPTKRATPLPNLSSQLLSYIQTHFRDTHPDTFKKDVNDLVSMRKEWVESGGEVHPEIIRGLMRYDLLLITRSIVG